jgi:hypothetical protein
MMTAAHTALVNITRIGLADSRFALTTSRTTDRFFLLYTPQFALGDVPTLTANRTEYTAVGNTFTETA